MVHIFLTSS